MSLRKISKEMIDDTYDKDVIIYPFDTENQIYAKLTTAQKSVYFTSGVYVLNGSTLPNRVISIQQPIKIFSESAIIYLERGTQFELKSEGIEVYGLQLRVRNHGTLLGGESCLLVRRGNIRIENCFMGGSMFYHGILIENKTEIDIHCNDVKIIGNEFNTLGFGILKQGNDVTGTDKTKAHRLYIHKNKFRTMQRGDAIEINTGGDKDFHITYNDIDGVVSGGIGNAGFAIGVAGHGLYADTDPEKLASNFTIAHNIIKNVESEGIHLEKSMNAFITDNQIMSAVTGIIIYGCKNISIEKNTISNVTRGISDSMGVDAQRYTVASDNNTIKNNHISNASGSGIISDATGLLITSYILNNTIINTDIGIYIFGRAIIHIKDNLIVDCDISLHFNYESLIAQSVGANAYRNIYITDNTTIYKGIVADNGKAVLNLVNYDSFVFENNTFKLGAFTRSPSVFTEDINEPLYFVIGDILNTVESDSTVTQKLVVANGFYPVSAILYFGATQGNDYFYVVTGGDAKNHFKPGQLVRLPGAGVGGAELVAMIEYFYIANNQYRVKINTNIGTTVGVARFYLTESAVLAQGGADQITVSTTAPPSLSTGGIWYQEL